MEKHSKDRFVYIDNLRLVMIILVIMVHSSVTYSGIGSWYYVESTKLSVPSLIIFAFFNSFTQSYFMGFLYLLAGYFVPRAYDTKGFTKFVKSRLVRLGIPTLIYVKVI